MKTETTDGGPVHGLKRIAAEIRRSEGWLKGRLREEQGAWRHLRLAIRKSPENRWVAPDRGRLQEVYGLIVAGKHVALERLWLEERRDGADA